MTQVIEAVKKQSQSDKILDSLLNGEEITAMDALYQFGCMRLAARISDIRKCGYEVNTKSRILATGKRIAVYSLRKEDEQSA